jgi:hypothetical protein
MRLSAAITEDKADAVLDPLRIAFLIAFITGIGLQIYTVVGQNNAFDIQAFGIGVGSLLATTGAALWASSHQKDEPA